MLVVYILFKAVTESYVPLWQTVKEKKRDFEYTDRDFPDEELATVASGQRRDSQEDCLDATAESAYNHQRVRSNEVMIDKLIERCVC
jgi:hypothetical protein